MKKQFFIYLALAMLLPSAIAFNCNSLSGGDNHICSSIQNTNLTSTEKDMLIADIFNKNKTSPNFDFVYSWNTNLNIPHSPDGRISYSGTIKNAWVKIIALMPSVIEDNTIYSSNTGKLRTEYNYEVQLPYVTESRDCSTSYSLVSQNENLNIFLNENLIGNQKLTSFNINQNYDALNFRSELSIQVRYQVTHYRYTYVNGYKRCRYYSAEYRTDNLKITSGLNSKLYKSQLGSTFKVTDKYYNITKGVLTANNFTNLILSFNNSNYQDSRYIYSLNYTLPYYILTLKAEKIENTKFNNVHVDKYNNTFYFNVKDTSKCKIQLFDHFSSQTKNCDLSFNETLFSITTDKTNYYENDTIKVYISPSNLVLNITYGSESKLAKNYTEFKAVLYQNKIYSKLNDKEEDWLVNINKKENTIFLYNLGVLGFLGYFFYKAGKVYLLRLI